MGRSLPGRPSTINKDRLAGDKRRRFGCKEYDYARYIHRLTNAVQRSNAFYYVRAECGIGETTLRSWSADKSRCDRIHSDVVLPPLNGKAFGQMSNGGLRHAIHRLGRECDESRL